MSEQPNLFPFDSKYVERYLEGQKEKIKAELGGLMREDYTIDCLAVAQRVEKIAVLGRKGKTLPYSLDPILDQFKASGKGLPAEEKIPAPLVVADIHIGEPNMIKAAREQSLRQMSNFDEAVTVLSSDPESHLGDAKSFIERYQERIDRYREDTISQVLNYPGSIQESLKKRMEEMPPSNYFGFEERTSIKPVKTSRKKGSGKGKMIGTSPMNNPWYNRHR